MVKSINMKSKDGIKRESYSLKIDLTLVKWLKHEAIERNMTVGQLVEEAIKILQAQKKGGKNKH